MFTILSYYRLNRCRTYCFVHSLSYELANSAFLVVTLVFSDATHNLLYFKPVIEINQPMFNKADNNLICNYTLVFA